MARDLNRSVGGEETLSETREGPVAREIESQTAKLPSDLWLWAAIASMAVSFGFQLSERRGRKHTSLFVGQWVPTLLLFGLYNKIVKVAGHARDDVRAF